MEEEESAAAAAAAGSADVSASASSDPSRLEETPDPCRRHPLHELPPWQQRASSPPNACYYSYYTWPIQWRTPRSDDSPTSRSAQTRSAAVSCGLFVCCCLSGTFSFVRLHPLQLISASWKLRLIFDLLRVDRSR